MSDYIIKHGVPIVDEHVMYDDQGDPLVNVDESVLHKIARKNNARVRLTGDEVPITIGHTKGELGDFVPEEDQPAIVGYARDFRVAPFFKTGKKCVTATFKLMKRYAHKIAKHPRRSIEIWLGDWKVDPISLLGATTPSRDLGLLRLAADGRKVYRRVLPAEKPMNQELVQEILKALEQTDVFQWAKQKMQEEEGAADGQGDEGGLPPEEGEDNLYADDMQGPAGDDAAEGDQPEEDAELSEAQEDGKAPVRMSGAACASGTNSFVPGTGKGRKRAAERERYAKTGDRIRMSRLEAENVSLKKQFNGLRVKLARAERASDLVSLQAEGYEFDLNEELDDVTHLTDEQYAKHLGKIRKRYSRGLTATTDWSQHSRTQAASGISSKEQALEVAEYARNKGITVEVARQELGLD